jgi:UDP-glucose 4-epimerase
MIAVTGGLGFIGAHTVRALVSLGQPCMALTRRPPPGPGPFADVGGQVTIVQADAGDRSSLWQAGEGHRISSIIHLAAPLPGPPGQRAAFVRTSISALLTVLWLGRA